MTRFFKLLIAGGLVLAAVAGLLYIIPSNEYIFLPDKARPLAPYVTVQGEHPDRNGGGIYYVAIEVKKASLLEKLFPGLREGSTLVPAVAVVAPGQNDQQHQRQELQAMVQSQEIVRLPSADQVTGDRDRGREPERALGGQAARERRDRGRGRPADPVPPGPAPPDHEASAGPERRPHGA